MDDKIKIIKEKIWNEKNNEINELLVLGAQDYFIKKFSDFKNYFSSRPRAVVCMDEGTAHKFLEGIDKFCLAGSGILYPAISNKERVEKVADLFVKLGIKYVYSHGACGAVELAYKRDFPDSEATGDKVDAYAEKWCEEVVARMNANGIQCEHRNIKAAEMTRPPEYHIARVVYFDAVGGFNPGKHNNLPMGFVIGRKFIPSEYAGEELKTVVNIAFGHHGFGELFSQELPFIVTVLAKHEEELKNLQKEIESILKDEEHFQKGNIKIDGLVVGLIK